MLKTKNTLKTKCPKVLNRTCNHPPKTWPFSPMVQFLFWAEFRSSLFDHFTFFDLLQIVLLKVPGPRRRLLLLRAGDGAAADGGRALSRRKKSSRFRDRSFTFGV